MRYLAVIPLLLALAAAAAMADDSAMQGGGGNPTMMTEHPSISMVREDVSINPVTQKVQARFVFKNNGPATTVLMGFPEHDEGDGSMTSKPKVPDNSFVSYIDGVQVHVAPVVGAMNAEGEESLVWWTKHVPFGAGQTRIVVDTYTGGGGDVATGNQWFTYILKSGDSWNGPIGRAVITCDMSGLPYSPIDIEPKGYVWQGDKIVWDWTNIKPSQDITLWWYPAFMDVTVNGSSVVQNRLKADGLAPSATTPIPSILSWDTVNWTPAFSHRIGSDVWIPAKAAAAWLGGAFHIVKYDTVVKISYGSHWSQATIGSKTLLTDSGAITMPYDCDHLAGRFDQGSGTMLSLESVVAAFKGTYHYDPNANTVTITLPPGN